MLGVFGRDNFTGDFVDGWTGVVSDLKMKHVSKREVQEGREGRNRLD